MPPADDKPWTGPLPATPGCDCHICRPDDSYDELDRRVVETVLAHGWQVMLVADDAGCSDPDHHDHSSDDHGEPGPPFAYTIGLGHRAGHPELLMSGLDTGVMHRALNDVALGSGTGCGWLRATRLKMSWPAFRSQSSRSVTQRSRRPSPGPVGSTAASRRRWRSCGRTAVACSRGSRGLPRSSRSCNHAAGGCPSNTPAVWRPTRRGTSRSHRTTERSPAPTWSTRARQFSGPHASRTRRAARTGASTAARTATRLTTCESSIWHTWSAQHRAFEGSATSVSTSRLGGQVLTQRGRPERSRHRPWLGDLAGCVRASRPARRDHRGRARSAGGRQSRHSTGASGSGS